MGSEQDRGKFSVGEGDTIVKQHRLEADSACSAWYEIALIDIREGYLVEKISGATKRAQHSEIWFRRSFIEAEKKYDGIIKDKTNPDRRSPRKYHLV